MRRKVIVASIIVFSIIFTLFAFNSVSFVEEDINISSSMINHLVYADLNEINYSDVEAKFVFSLSESVSNTEEKIGNLETTVQSAYSTVINNAVIEQEKKLEEERLRREEEARREAELAAYRETVGDTYNPFVKTGLTAEQFNTILAGTGLEGCGQSYYNMEQTYGVNGVFAISVAFHESGYGKYKANTNNFYGMRGNSGWMAFESPDANIQYFGKLMNKSMYYGKSILGIGQVYCPGTHTSWANAVKGMMDRCYKKV